MKKNFWHNLPKPFFALAPMESVTDVVFRHVIAHAAKPDIFFTEFVNASSFCSPKGAHSTKGRLTFTLDEQPIVAQIWGKNPSEFEKMSIELAKMGFTGIDINMGCPDKAVVRTGSGSALIRTPELAAHLISSAKKSGLPVSVKTRIGDYKPDEWHNWLKFILEQDIVNLTIHLRTRKEMSKVPAHYELIPEIIKLRDEIAPQTLITINGDVMDRQQGARLAEKYGVDGIMIGRGVFTNPYAFEDTKKDHTKTELINLLKLQLDLHDKYSAELEARKFDPLKRFFKIYIRNFPGASELRDKLMHTKSTDEARELINQMEAIDATQE
jgi:tRNA-dihydrouridine synthase